ncbi:DinB family protein [Lacinutrix salivirga]
MRVSDLKSNEYLPYFSNYISKVGDLQLMDALHISLKEGYDFFKSIPEDKLEYRYAEGKWTIKDILLHIIDTERIFCYRALRFAREDKTALPGFDQNTYAESSNANDRTMESLLSEYISVRNATVVQFLNFNSAMLLQKGTASGGEISVRAFGFLVVGHETHHIEVIKERYL